MVVVQPQGLVLGLQPVEPTWHQGFVQLRRRGLGLLAVMCLVPSRYRWWVCLPLGLRGIGFGLVAGFMTAVLGRSTTLLVAQGIWMSLLWVAPQMVVLLFCYLWIGYKAEVWQQGGHFWDYVLACLLVGCVAVMLVAYELWVLSPFVLD